MIIAIGLHTYGGMAGRDMEAMARGIEESAIGDSLANVTTKYRYY
ncbi:MAG: hypothetical protein ACYT04_56645 [Nostoc sp.]